jgi:hypothetical protein
MPGISKGSTIKFLLAENKCYAFSLSLPGTASALGTLAVRLKNKPMRKTAFLILFFISLKCYSACRCEIMGFREEANAVRFIFHGRVVSVLEDEFEFKIIKSWKGVYVSENFKINTRTSCSLHKKKFELNKEYLIYTKDSSMTHCSRTCEIDSTRDMVLLDLLFGARERRAGSPSLTQPQFELLKRILRSSNVPFPDNLPEMKILYACNKEIIDKERFLELTFDSPAGWNNIILFKTNADSKYVLWTGFNWKKSYRHLKSRI